MLQIYLGEMAGSIYHPPTYFDNQYEDEWIVNPLSKAMIKDVDKSEVLNERIVDSPVLGTITIKELSGGVKTLMLFAFDKSGKVFNASVCGDNCARWILKIGAQRDLTINLRHLMNFGDGPFEIKILNTNEVVHNMAEFGRIARRYV